VAEADPREAADLPRAIAVRVIESVGVEADYVVVVAPGALPRTSSGKLQRSRTRELFLSGVLPVLAGKGLDAFPEDASPLAAAAARPRNGLTELPG
ncbi:MAG TPA: hypothetical protein VOA00_05860, partial [Thermoanaerobaculia bacterium]|nr:hypothetical protein [Thermoanaerobaculia bacterium]